MAIAKMEKLIVIAQNEQNEDLLTLTQGLQGVELFSAEPYADGAFFSREREKAETTLQEKLDKVQRAIAYLDVPSGLKVMIAQYRDKSPLLSLAEVNRRAEASGFMQTAEQILSLEHRQRKIADRRKEYAQQEAFLLRWQDVPFSPNQIPKGKLINIHFYEADASQRESIRELFQTHDGLYGDFLHQNDENMLCVVAIWKNDETAIKKELQNLGLREVIYPFDESPKTALQSVHAKMGKLAEQENDIIQERKKLSKERAALQIGEEYLAAALEREKQKENLLQSEHALIMTGWIPSANKRGFEKRCKDVLGDSVYIEYEGVEKGEEGDVPILLKNKKLIRPFETLTEMYSLPQYSELDPTPYLSIFYWVFFGMMVADTGYGLLLGIATGIALRFFTLRRGMRKSLEFFHLLSYSTVIWGLIYGSAFGEALPFHLLSTSDDINTILILSVAMGYVQLVCGLVLQSVLLWREGKKLDMFSGPCSWLGILVSAVIVVLGLLVFKNQSVGTFGIILGAACALFIVVGYVISSSSPAKGIAKGLYELYGISGYLGDLVSYTRLMAIGIAGGSIGAAFNLIIGFMPPIARFTIGALLLVALHGLNIFLSFLSAYVHGARLQYVEFFGKFYQGGGRAFQPLKAKEKHFDIQNEE